MDIMCLLDMESASTRGITIMIADYEVNELSNHAQKSVLKAKGMVTGLCAP